MTSPHFTIYDDSTGEVRRVVTAPHAVALLNVKAGESLVEGRVDWRTHYVPQGAVTPRPDGEALLGKRAIQADGVDAAVVRGVPPGATVTISGPAQHAQQVHDGTVELTTPLPGAYTLTVKAFPFKAQEFSVVAN